MNPQIRRLFQAYISRRSPWGPPWWIYAVSYGVLNLIRQAVIILAAADLSTPLRIASWVATALIVIGGVNTVAAILRWQTVRRDAHTAAVHETVPVRTGARREAA